LKPSPNEFAKLIIFFNPIVFVIDIGTILDELLNDSIKDTLPLYSSEKFFGQ